MRYDFYYLVGREVNGLFCGEGREKTEGVAVGLAVEHAGIGAEGCATRANGSVGTGLVGRPVLLNGCLGLIPKNEEDDEETDKED